MVAIQFTKIFLIQFFCVFFPFFLGLFRVYQVCTTFILYCAHLWEEPSLMFPIFLKRSLVFPLLLFSSIIKHSSLKKLFLSLLAIFLNSAFNRMYVSSVPCLPFSSSAVCKAPQITTLPSCFSLGWFCSPPRVQYYGCLSIVLQAHCYLDLVP